MKHLFNRLARAGKKKAAIVMTALVITGAAVCAQAADPANNNIYTPAEIPQRVLDVNDDARNRSRWCAPTDRPCSKG